MVQVVLAMMLAGVVIVVAVLQADDLVAVFAGFAALCAIAVVGVAQSEIDERRRAVERTERGFAVEVVDDGDAPEVFVVADRTGPRACSPTKDDRYLVCTGPDGSTSVRGRVDP